MRRRVLNWTACGIATAAVTSLAFAASDPVFDDGLPRVWTWNTPLGDAANDPRFVQMVQCHISYLSQPGYSPITAANDVATQISNRGLTDGRIAILMLNVGLGNLRTGPSIPTNPQRIPALYAHTYDMITYTDAFSNVQTCRTPWMNSGVAETKAWMDQFLAQYQVKVNNGTIPCGPNRFVFDQEPEDIEPGVHGLPINMSSHAASLPNTIAYWNALVGHTNWTTLQLIGFPPGTTAYDHWKAHNFPVPTIPVPYNYGYYGGSKANQEWYEWFMSMIFTIQGGAMKLAFYDGIHSAFPGCQVSDYHYGVFADGVNTNKFMNASYDSCVHDLMTGAPRGVQMAWNGRTDLQAVVLYPSTSGYNVDQQHIPTVNYPIPIIWQSYQTDDLCVTGQNWFAQSVFSAFGRGIEPPTESALRICRYNADAASRSSQSPGQTNWGTLAPWVTMPDEMFKFPILPKNATQTMTTLHRAETDDIVRMFGIAKARGTKEMMVWNNSHIMYNPCGTSFPDLYNSTVCSQHPAKWTRMAHALDGVWRMRILGAVPYNASAVLPPNTSLTGQIRNAVDGLSGQLVIGPTNCAGDFGVDVDALLTGADAGVSGAKSSGFGSDGLAERLRVNIDVIASAACTLQCQILNRQTNGWETVDMNPSDNALAATSRALCAGTTVRTSGVFTPTASVPSGTNPMTVYTDELGVAKLRITTSGAPAATVYYDAIQVLPIAPLRRIADFNGDDKVDQTDVIEFQEFFAAYLNDPTNDCLKNEIKWFVDLNRDDVVDTADYTVFGNAFNNCNNGNCNDVVQW